MCAESKKQQAVWPEGVGMVYLAMSPWAGMWKNRHQLMSRFAREMPVLYVEPWVRLRHLRRQGLKGLWRPTRNSLTEQAPNLFTYRSPDSRPVSGSRYLEKLTGERWLSGVRAAAAEVGITRPVLWLSLPEMHFAVGQMNELLSVYHVVDEYGGYSRQNGGKAQRLRAHEQKILESVDLSIVVSPELAESKSRHGRNIRIVENAVDFETFSRARTNNHTPDEIKAIPQPRLGYSGLIGQRLNLELLLRIASERPDWSLVFVGKVDETECADRLTRLRAQPNVHFLGEKPIREVPDYVAAFDVGLLPYALNLETTNISPLKMYEYFAVDIPVVATAIPSALRSGDYLRIAGTDDEFIAACAESVVTEEDPLSAARVAHARENTWDIRVDQATTLLQETLHGKEAALQ